MRWAQNFERATQTVSSTYASEDTDTGLHDCSAGGSWAFPCNTDCVSCSKCIHCPQKRVITNTPMERCLYSTLVKSTLCTIGICQSKWCNYLVCFLSSEKSIELDILLRKAKPLHRLSGHLPIN